MKQRLILLTILLTTLTPLAWSLTREEQMQQPNEIRLGWGDMLYETAVYHSTPTIGNYRYTGHLFAEYQRSLKAWLSVGMQLDYEQVWWNQRPDIYSDYTADKHSFYNIALLPTLRFTYFFRPYVNLYSAVNIGLTINGGTETDMKGRYTACAPALGVTLLGVQVGRKHVFGAVEIGGLSALMGKNYIYMFDSRIFTASIGCRF